MKRMHFHMIALVLLVSLFHSLESHGQNSSGFLKNHVSGGVNIILRNELWNTFQKQDSDTDRTYDFFLIRARAYFDLDWEHIAFHVMGQGVKAFNLPENAAFGPGMLYYTASDENTSPGNFQFVEAYIHLKNLRGFYLKGGRMGFKDGGQVVYTDSPKLNWVINNRLAERLIGNWDWTLIGRRYDGGNGGWTNEMFDINIMGANVTFGGFDIEDGYWKDLDTVGVFGGAFTVKEGVLVENTQFQLFNYFYFDNRDPAITLAGNDLKINTTGVSIVGAYPMGAGELDTMLWLAFQLGDFGLEDQRALAFIAELGYQFTLTPWEPWLRFGIAYASGDRDPDDSNNGTFFNMVPTNHKWYGYADTQAFSNIIDLYNQILLKPHKKVLLGLEGHFFWLASDDEVWIGGSGPFNDSVFGYSFRNPTPGNNIESFLGGEIDITLSFDAYKYLVLQAGYSHYFGADGVEAIFDAENQLDWFYAQATIPISLGE